MKTLSTLVNLILIIGFIAGVGVLTLLKLSPEGFFTISFLEIIILVILYINFTLDQNDFNKKST